MIIHPTSDVQSTNIGKGTRVWQYCVILRDAVIGEDCNINFNVFIENEVRVGNNVTIKPGVQLWDGLCIEDNVFIGPNATFTNDIIPRSLTSKERELNPFVKRSTHIKHGATIGANATIVAGVVIGEYAFIGAGSVVTKDIPANTVWYGNPAKQQGYITKDGVLLDNTLKSKDGKQYSLKNESPLEND